MRKGAPVTVFAVSLGLFAFAAVADGHTLKKSWAKGASAKLAHELCDKMTAKGYGCEYHGIERCKYRGDGHRDRHRARCSAYAGGADDSGPWRCDWLEIWRFTDGGKKIANDPRTSNRTFRCYDPAAP